MTSNAVRGVLIVGVFGVTILSGWWLGWVLTNDLGFNPVVVSAGVGVLVILAPQSILNVVLTKWPQGTHPDGSPKIGYRFGGTTRQADQAL